MSWPVSTPAPRLGAAVCCRPLSDIVDHMATYISRMGVYYVSRLSGIALAEAT